MKKRILVLLIAVMLAASAGAGAEYNGYQLTVGDPYGDLGIYPLDGRNAVIGVRNYREDCPPWNAVWYRDGQAVAVLEGTECMDRADGRLRIPRPAAWDGERLAVCWYDPDEDRKPYLAQWEEPGLTGISPAPDGWYGVFGCGRITVYRGDSGWRLLAGGTETVLPQLDPGQEQILSCVQAAPEVFLLKMRSEESGTCAVCLDRGEVRYRTPLPAVESIQDRLFLPDRNGGFFLLDGYLPGDYTPVSLMHYRADGQQDRRISIAGKRLVTGILAGSVDPCSGLCTLYGSAVAHSRKVYTVFAMTLDDDLNVAALDVRKIDPAYGDYCPQIYTAPDGTAWVLIRETAGNYGLLPVLIPFSKLKKSKSTYGLSVR